MCVTSYELVIVCCVSHVPKTMLFHGMDLVVLFCERAHCTT